MATKGTVVLYFSRLGAPLRAHQKALLKADAKAIARLKQYYFEEQYDALKHYASPIYFVPDDTLLLDEAQSLGIQSPKDLYGGVVPYPFVKTKSITHPLVGETADQPGGWSFQFADRVRNIVLPGYTVFGFNDARVAAERVLPHGPIRIKRSTEAGGRGQTLIATVEELEAVLEEMSTDEIANYGLVLEENLDQVTTLSIGHIIFDNIRFTYHGRQQSRRTTMGSRLMAVPILSVSAEHGTRSITFQ